MGMIFAKIWSSFYGVEEVKIIIVGLNNAGKTTTLYKLLLNEVVVTAPTIGSNVEELVYKNIRFVMWDIGGQDSARSSWDTYYIHTKAVIMVIDSTDRERMNLNKQELQKMLANESLRGAALLVYANKQDLKGAMSAAEITEALNLHSIRDTIWHIQACCALTGEGLESGLEWISQNVKRNKQ